MPPQSPNAKCNGSPHACNKMSRFASQFYGLQPKKLWGHGWPFKLKLSVPQIHRSACVKTTFIFISSSLSGIQICLSSSFMKLFRQVRVFLIVHLNKRVKRIGVHHAGWGYEPQQLQNRSDCANSPYFLNKWCRKVEKRALALECAYLNMCCVQGCAGSTFWLAELQTSTGARLTTSVWEEEDVCSEKEKKQGAPRTGIHRMQHVYVNMWWYTWN